MGLNYDWHCFQSIFEARRRSVVGTVVPVIFLVLEGETILAVFADGEDFSEWIGSKYSELAAEMPHRELILVSREQAEEWAGEGLSYSHFYEQVESAREKATQANLRKVSGTRQKEGEDLPIARHFLLEAIRGWWAKFLPSSYGIFLRLEEEERNQEILLIVRRGRVDSFCEPELSSIGADRLNRPTEVVKHLAEKHLVPVQAVFVKADKWREWSNSGEPWREVSLSIRANETRLVPFRWGLAGLISSRGFFGF